MFVIHTKQIIHESNLDDILTEILRRIIPVDIKKKLSSKKSRKELLEKYGEKAFLIPSELKYPLIDPRTGEYSKELVYAAKIRIRQFVGKKPGYRELYNKICEIEKNCKHYTLPVVLENEYSKVRCDLLTLVESVCERGKYDTCKQ